ncbi:unnamed protein product [Linum tenue]|uniref:Uncharacterized protein n=1 Tax=Linum tenue TaxID=586396 RepID=A0AAV0J0E9_9ROSI|nr:unnamed protein product [Linum tenue]
MVFPVCLPSSMVALLLYCFCCLLEREKGTKEAKGSSHG